MAADDRFGQQMNPIGGIRRARVVTPDDNTDLTEVTRGIYVGVTGDVAVIPVDNGDVSVVMKNKTQGYWHADRVKRVLSTGTTATNILAGF